MFPLLKYTAEEVDEILREGDARTYGERPHEAER